jgi:hypothetical protein
MQKHLSLPDFKPLPFCICPMHAAGTQNGL